MLSAGNASALLPKGAMEAKKILINKYNNMKSETTGWVVINKNHPNSKKQIVCDSTFSETRSQAIKKFLSGTCEKWNYWKRYLAWRGWEK